MSVWKHRLITTSFIVTMGLSSIAHAALPIAVNGDALPSLAPVLETVTPAVVSISVSGTKVSNQQIPEVFRYFFGPEGNPNGNGPQERPFQGLGSGVIINADKGYVITNSHVIAEADEILVSLNDGREYEATVLGSDKETDIALVQIEAKDLHEVKFADSDQLRVGDFVVAIGNPFGLGQTVTSGIVSALGRSGLNVEKLENFIQTDAAINSGNSGGALINLRGELIGINTAIIAPGGGNIGIGFAIPSNMVQNLSEQIVEFGEIRRGVLGVMGGELNSELAEAFGIDSQNGAFVNEVMPDSAASEAGIQAGDIIVSVNSKTVDSFAELRAKIGTMGAGKTVQIGVMRDGKRQTLEVTLKRSNEQNVKAKVMHPALEGALLSAAEKGPGVLVSKIERGSPADQNGLEEGDIIVGVNKTELANLAELRGIFETEPSILALKIKRGDTYLYRILR